MRRSDMLLLGLTVVLIVFAQMASADPTNRYVVKDNSGAAEPYDAWTNAAADIQTAIDYAYAGETVWVSNGVYETGGVTNWPAGTILTNRVAIDKAITVRSANNDPTNTIIKGAWNPGTTNGPAAVRCVYMVNNSSLIGFTLTNGATLRTNESAVVNDRYGGGVWCQSTAAIISNCVIVGNSADSSGGGAWYGTLNNCTLTSNSAFYGGGAAYSTLYNCTMVGNSSVDYGGGAYLGTLSNCTMVGNSSGRGGGASHSTLYNCTIVSNSVGVHGGGTYLGTLYNCMLRGNSAGSYGGGAVDSTPLYNCTIVGNSAGNNGGGVAWGTLYNCTIAGNSAAGNAGGAQDATLYNCTIVGNSAGNNGGGAYLGTLINCIVYFNTATTSGSNWYEIVAFTNSCTVPAATNGVGNITDDPRLVDKGSGYGTNHVAGNYRLAAGSPCRNTGTNFSWMTDPADPRSKDLDGINRIDKYSGQVDMGCYEYLSPPPGTIFSVR